VRVPWRWLCWLYRRAWWWRFHPGEVVQYVAGWRTAVIDSRGGQRTVSTWAFWWEEKRD